MFQVQEKPLIASYLKSDLIHFLKVKSRDDAIKALIKSLKNNEVLNDTSAFLTAILAREKLVSTAIGLGIAIPHAKQEDLEDFFITVGIVEQPGIEWDSIDGLPVRLIFLIGGPANDQTRYLKILSLLTEAIRSESFRNDLLLSHHPMDVIKLFERI
jgi:PTS system nitrogen regulatory IIA component